MNGYAKLSQKELDEFIKIMNVDRDTYWQSDEWQLFWNRISIKYKFNPARASISEARGKIDKNFYRDNDETKNNLKIFKKRVKDIKIKQELYASQKRRRFKRLQAQEQSIPDSLWVRVKDYV